MIWRHLSLVSLVQIFQTEFMTIRKGATPTMRRCSESEIRAACLFELAERLFSFPKMSKQVEQPVEFPPRRFPR